MEQKQIKIKYVNRSEVESKYANNFNVAFNPYEFTIEFALIDASAANSDIESGKDEIGAKIVSKILLSEPAMTEFLQLANSMHASYKKALEAQKNG